MKVTLKITLLALIAFSNTACSVIGSMKASPAENSGFLGEVAELTVADEQYPFHRTYFPDEAKPVLDKVQKIHIATVNTDFLKNKSIYFGSEESAKEAVKEDAAELSSFTKDSFEHTLKKEAADKFILVDAPTKDALVLELALVEVTPTDVARNVLGTALGTVVPGAGLVAVDGTGTVAIEGRLINKSTGEVIFAFADREAGQLSLFSLKDFSLYGHARAVIEAWAEQVTETFETSGRTRVVDSSPVTLSPI